MANQYSAKKYSSKYANIKFAKISIVRQLVAWVPSLVILLAILIIMGCHAGDPFRRQHNPLKGYESLTDDALTYDPNNLPKKPVDPDNSQFFCTTPMSVSIGQEDVYNQNAYFSEGREQEVELVVRSFMGDKFDVTYTLPEGASAVDKQQSGNTAIHKIKWTPPPGFASQDKPVYELKVGYSSPAIEEKCGRPYVGYEVANFIVKKSRGEAEIRSINLDDLDWSKASKTIEYRVVVWDPSFDSKTGPVVESSAITVTSPILNASAATTCGTAVKDGKLKQGEWVVTCLLDPEKIDWGTVKPEEGNSYEAAFALKVKSIAGIESVSEKKFKINIPKGAE